VLLSSSDYFPHLIQKRRSQLGFVTYLLNYPRSFHYKFFYRIRRQHPFCILLTQSLEGSQKLNISLENRLKERSINPDRLVAWATKFCILLPRVYGSPVCRTWLCHPSGFKNFEVAPRFVDNLHNRGLKLKPF